MGRPLSTRRFWTLAALIVTAGVVLRAPALQVGFKGDDYVQRAMLQGTFPGVRQPWDLFRFAGPEPSDNLALLDAGYLPYWSDPALRLAMFRPLSSLLLYLDHQLWPDDAALHHAHSLLWWTLACLAVALVLRQLLPARVALLALALFSLDESATIPVAWLANRSALPAVTLGALTLYAQARASQGRQPRMAIALGTLSLTACLLSGEYGYGMLGYVFAFAWLHPGALPRRGYLPLALPPVAVLSLRAAMGYGARGSELYLSPLSDPASFAAAALGRAGLLASHLWTGVPLRWATEGHPLRPLTLRLATRDLSLYQALPSAGELLALVGWVCLGALCWWASRPRLRNRRPLLVLLCGSALALLPASAPVPEDRLLMSAALGQSGVLAFGLAHALKSFRSWASVSSSRGLRIVVAVVSTGLAAVHLLHAPADSLRRIQAYAETAQLERRRARTSELPTTEARAARAQVFLVTAPDFLTAANLPYVRQGLGLPLVPHYQRLHGAFAPMDIRRIDDHSLELRVMIYNLSGSQAGTLYRRRDSPVQPGARFHAPGLAVEVLDARFGSASRLRYRFDRALDDPDLHLLHVDGPRLKRILLPGAGETLRLPAPGYRD